MKKSLRSLLLATAIVTISYSAAFADMVYNRGNSADPESLDPHKTSTVYEAHILRDLFSGLVMQGRRAARAIAVGSWLSAIHSSHMLA